jgi:predicted nucleotide-binding protein
MNNRVPTSKLLKDAWRKVKDRAALATDIDDKISWEQRRALLDDEIRSIQMLEEGTDLPRTVFISYSTTSGNMYFSRLKQLLTEAKFDVVTGFDDIQGSEGNILKTVLKQLARSTFYIGILTKEIKVDQGRNARWSPGVWIMEEKGMALALGKPFLLMVHKEIHDDFWKKTTPMNLHISFDESDFESKAQEALNRVEGRYAEDLIRSSKAMRGPRW